MYNKIASIILNSAKADGLSDVFVSQPDSLKENLAGKIFVLAEIGGKKSEGRKIFDFLLNALNDNYYNDEKILFRGKIEGLKIENIFEAAIAKTNKNLADFLSNEKIKINPTATNITLGVIFENNLHFASFGRNRALLLYRRGDEYEIINVETNAAEAPLETLETDPAGALTPKLFSSVISGEVPLNSYFIFTSEALPEYLSGREMIRIVTKLPPITAAEQIKNVLTKINTYVPFLGIIIKNTTGLSGQEIKDDPEESSAAHSSISSLNYTEAKTEQMLAPAGLISFSKFSKQLKQWFSRGRLAAVRPPRKYIRADDKPDEAANGPLPALNLGQVKSLNSVRADSFLIKEKIFFGKKSGWLKTASGKLFSGLAAAFNPRHWSGLPAAWKSWTTSLSSKNRWLFIALAAVVIVFVASLIFTNINHQRQIADANFNSLVTNIQNQEDAIDAHLIYNDEAGAKQIFIQTQALLSSLPQTTKEQQTVYQRLAAKLQANQDKIEKIVHITNAAKVNDLSGLGVNNLAYAGGKIYGASGKIIYRFTPGVTAYSKVTVSGADNLSNPVYYAPSTLYYWDSNQIVQYNSATSKSSLLPIASVDPAAGVVSFKMFYGNLYLLAKNKNQIYRYVAGAGGFSAKKDWLVDVVDLSQASDLYIDGNIYVLKNNGQVLKFYTGQAQNYASQAIDPVMDGASKLIVGTNNIYVFEASSKRLVVLAKSDGHLLSQYELDTLKSPQDFSVDEVGKTAYVLDGAAVYKIALAQ